MRLALWIGPLAAGLAVVVPAAADSVNGTRSEKLYETKHEVLATLHPGWAELRVRRTVENQGDRHDQAMFWIDAPPNAVATSLRTLGSAGGKPRWFAGELMEAEAAAAKYRELTGIGGYYPKDPALLSWRSQELLALQVFPVAPKGDKTVEYTFLVPTRYEHGAHRYTLPALGTATLNAEVTLGVAPRGDKLMLADKPASAGTRITPKPGESVELALVPASQGPLSGELALAAVSKTKLYTELAVAAAPRVSQVPKGAYVVVVLDASRSLSSEDIAAERVAARAYLRHFPDAKVEAITFDRHSHSRYGQFVGVERARRDLGAMSIPQKNGSAVDDALADAEHALAGAPAGHARRILLLSDALTRQSLKPERVRAALGSSGAVVHLVEFHAGGVELARDDGHKWAEAARATGGLAWRASARSDSSRAELAAFEEWARPLRVDHLQIFSPDIELFSANDSPPDRLDEGEGLTRTLWGRRAVSWVRIEGELWSEHVEELVHASPEAGKRWSALIFGQSGAIDGLSDAEMMTLAMHGGAVSPVTSYLAIEPGVRPSTEGLERGEAMGFGHGVGSPSIRMGATAVGGRAPALDRDAWLRDALRPTWLACGGKLDSVSVAFETTFAEVVDVGAVSLTSGKDPILERCLSEAVWDLVLPPQFRDDWAPWSVSL